MVIFNTNMQQKWTGIFTSLLLFVLSIGYCQAQEQIDIKPVRNWIMVQAGIGSLGDFQLKPDLGSTYDYYLIKPNLSSTYELNWEFHIKRKMSINTGISWSRNRYTNTLDFKSGNPFTIDSMKFTLTWGDRYDLLYFPLEIAFHAPVNKTLAVFFKAGVCGNYLDYDVTTSGLVKNHTDTIFKGIFTLNKTDKIFMSLRASLGLNIYISKNFSITLNGAYVYSNKKILEGRINYLINNQSVSEQQFSQKLKQFQLGFGLRLSLRSVSKLFY